MIKRNMTPELKAAALEYPVVTVLGPRQSGKTTLVKHTFSQKPYFSLEDPDIRQLATEDPRAFLSRLKDGAILDEIQQAPHLLSYIQTIVDTNNIKGEFILTGSHQPQLHQSISQSLAGRTAILTLLPLNLEEVPHKVSKPNIDELILKGGFPRLHKDNLNPTKFYRNYLKTYIERDVRTLINVKDLLPFEKCLKLLAGRVGQLINFSTLATDVGISPNTIKAWLSVLEASFIIIRLSPFYENFNKRVVKSPKIYFTDVGLAAYLLGLENTQQVWRDPLRGQLFENLVILEYLKHRHNQGLDPNYYFYRDTHGNEVDLIFTEGHQLTGVEIKSTETFQPHLLKNLKHFEKTIGHRFKQGFLVYAGEIEQSVNETQLINYQNITKTLNHNKSK